MAPLIDQVTTMFSTLCVSTLLAFVALLAIRGFRLVLRFFRPKVTPE